MKVFERATLAHPEGKSLCAALPNRLQVRELFRRCVWSFSERDGAAQL
jgi:hypothetical protein